jgi:serine protease Do
MSAAKSRGRTAGLIVATLAAASLLSWTLISGVGQGQPSPASTANGAQAIERAESLSRAFRAAAAQVRPTVVKITTTNKPRSSTDPRNRSDDPFGGVPSPFRDFFGDDLPGFRWFEIPNVPRQGLGSGVIIDPSGVVLTNNHVIAGADEVTVQLGDGTVVEVEETKTDERTDLAVLILDTDQTLPAARLGDSDRLEIGDWVLAIGNPFELEQTVSAGIISGKGRVLGSGGPNRVERTRARFLQTDAAINPGNSGGPLVNLKGEVVGINTAIFSRTGGYQGIGFAIPSNLARWVTPQLIKQGEVARAYLGVIIKDIDAEKGKELNLAPGSGVTVELVGEGSPAEAAGLKLEDVILTFDGSKISTAADLQELVERSAAGSRHELRIRRDGKTQTVQVVLKQMRPDFERAMMDSEEEARLSAAGFHQNRQLGLVVAELSDEIAKQLGFEGVSGVLIWQVDRERIAAQAGLRRGMVITRVGDRAVSSAAEFAEAIEKESLARGITLELRTSRGTQTVTLQSS